MEDVATYKALGAGIAACGMIGAGIGLGLVFGNYFQAISRQPAAEKQLRLFLFMGMAFVEAIALFAFVISILILNS